jgi:enterochelin esterase family protein
MISSSAFAQDAPGAGKGAAPGPRGPNRGPRPVPGRGPTPLPILPALAGDKDTSFFAETDVPHGKVEQVTYKNGAGQEKRMHVYLPPELREEHRHPLSVLYLNHGGGENDSHWSSTKPNGGSAHFILDNLIAAGKARPMIIAMPNTGGIVSATPPALGEDDACTREYLKDIIPCIEIVTGPNRAVRTGRSPGCRWAGLWS